MADISPRALGAMTSADFFTTGVWTWHGPVTYHAAVVIELASRRVQVIESGEASY